MAALAFLLILAAPPARGDAEAEAELEALISAKEAAVRRIASTAESLYPQRCASLSSCGLPSSASTLDSTSGTCALAACGSVFAASHGFECNSDFGQSDRCSCEGSTISKVRSTVRIPPGVDPRSDSGVAADLCGYRGDGGAEADGLDAVFRDVGDDLSAWVYFGTTTGTYHSFPGNVRGRENDQCDAYDPRLRPWYVRAASGPKSVVYVLDVSGSMSHNNSPGRPARGSRLDAVKSAVAASLATLTPSDFVGIVTFSSEAEIVNSEPTLVRATPENIEALVRSVDRLFPGGGTEFVPALELAFDLLAVSEAQEATSNCISTILFLTDGVAEEDSAEILAAAAAGQEKVAARATIFTYSMSSSAEKERPHALACANDGVWERIKDGQDPLVAMSKFYSDVRI